MTCAQRRETYVDLRTNLSQRKSSRTQEYGKGNASWTQVENLDWLASPFCQGLVGQYTLKTAQLLHSRHGLTIQVVFKEFLRDKNTMNANNSGD